VRCPADQYDERASAVTSSTRPGWPVPTGLLLLSAVPIIAGASRVAELAGGAEVTQDNARFFDMPVPVLVHIFGASIYCLLGAFQFAARFRRRHPRWHRVAGRILVPCGLAVALSGLWMTVFYRLPASDNQLLEVFRLGFGSAMLGSLVLGFVAIRRRDFVGHRAWMIRGYAIAMGAGTQVFTHLPWLLLVGQPSGYPRAMMMFAGWAINLAVAEWVIRRRPNRHNRSRRSPASPGASRLTPLDVVPGGGIR